MNPRYLLAWIPGIPIAIANGMIREFVYRRWLDELPAHQLSVVSFILLFGLYVWMIIPWLHCHSVTDALRVGMLWLVLTVGFEFLFGHFVMGHPWPTLFHDYNVFEGRLWVGALAWTLVAPGLVWRLQRNAAGIRAPSR
jgi:hypothetical protein